MKGSGQSDERFANQIENEPDDNKSKKELTTLDEASPAAPLKEGNMSKFFEARGAQDPVVMFGNTLATIELAA